MNNKILLELFRPEIILNNSCNEEKEFLLDNLNLINANLDSLVLGNISYSQFLEILDQCGCNVNLYQNLLDADLKDFGF
jgi:hypothetical protein